MKNALRSLLKGKHPAVIPTEGKKEVIEECTDQSRSFSEDLVRLLKERKMKISVAESFTGGNVSKEIVSVSGASEVFYEGIVAYDSKAKIRRLGVRKGTIGSVGAVSAETAYQMIDGLLKTGYCDLAIATTGLAGPKSDDSGLPVGLCYLAVGTSDGIRVYQYHLDGDRERITNVGVNLALYHAIQEVKNKEKTL